MTKGYLSSVVAAHEGSAFTEVDRREIVRVSGSTGGEVWRAPAEGFGIASVSDRHLLVTNMTWTAARGMSVESGQAVYRLDARKLRLWRNRWMLMTDDRLVLVDPATGEAVETRSPLPSASSDAGLTRIDGDVMLYQSEENTQVVAYDLSRQELLWKRPLRREIRERFEFDVSSVLLRPIEPHVFLAHVMSRIVVGCSLTDGSILWDMPVPFNSPVVAHRDRVYVMLAQEGRESSPRLVCLDAVTGAKVYDAVQSELNAMDLATYGTVYGDHIGFGTRGGLIGLFRLADGMLAWSYRYKAPLFTPAIAGERVYVCADDGNLLIFERG